MKIIRLSSLFSLTLLVGFGVSFSADKPWKNAAEFSYLSSNGNSKEATISGKDTFEYRWTKTALELNGGGYGASSDGEQTAEKYFAGEKLTYKLSDRNYAFENGAWDKDRFSGIKSRTDLTAGLGRELLKLSHDLLIGELGLGHVIEERYNAKTNSFDVGRIYSKYTRTISETVSFSQDAEFLANFKNKEDFRVNTESALLAALSTHFSLKVSYTWKYVGKPPPGFGRNDTTALVALVATY